MAVGSIQCWRIGLSDILPIATSVAINLNMALNSHDTKSRALTEAGEIVRYLHRQYWQAQHYVIIAQ